MSLKTTISDGSGTEQTATVADKSLLVCNVPYPPNVEQKVKVYRSYMTTTAGSTDMGIDGSSTPVSFSAAAHEDEDTYITTLSFEIVCGTQPQFWEFADSNAALSNGIRLFYRDAHGNEVDIHDAMKNNWDIIRLCLGNPSYAGGIDDAFIVKHVGAANDYGLIPVLDLTKLVPPFGIKLEKGSKQNLTLVINDDCTDADAFNVIAYGFRRFH